MLTWLGALALNVVIGVIRRNSGCHWYWLLTAYYKVSCVITFLSQNDPTHLPSNDAMQIVHNPQRLLTLVWYHEYSPVRQNVLGHQWSILDPCPLISQHISDQYLSIPDWASILLTHLLGMHHCFPGKRNDQLFMCLTVGCWYAIS